MQWHIFTLDQPRGGNVWVTRREARRHLGSVSRCRAATRRLKGLDAAERAAWLNGNGTSRLGAPPTADTLQCERCSAQWGPSTQPGARRKSQPPSALGSDDPPRSSSSPLLRPSSAVSSFPHIILSAGPSPLPQGSSSRDDIEAPVVSRKGPFFPFTSFLGAHKIVTCRVHDPWRGQKRRLAPRKDPRDIIFLLRAWLIGHFQLHPPPAPAVSRQVPRRIAPTKHRFPRRIPLTTFFARYHRKRRFPCNPRHRQR